MKIEALDIVIPQPVRTTQVMNNDRSPVSSVGDAMVSYRLSRSSLCVLNSSNLLQINRNVVTSNAAAHSRATKTGGVQTDISMVSHDIDAIEAPRILMAAEVSPTLDVEIGSSS